MAAVNKVICSVICAGEVSDYRWLKESVGDSFVICADAGYLRASKAGITPHVTIGDFDSAQKPTKGETRVFPLRKDNTDSALAIEHGISLGHRVFHVYAATKGARLDHTFANLAMCAYYCKRGYSVTLLDETNEATVLTPGCFRFCRDSRKLSLFAFGGKVTGLTETGVSYPLEDFTLEAENHLGVSNEIVEDFCEISFKSGLLMIIRSKD